VVGRGSWTLTKKDPSSMAWAGEALDGDGEMEVGKRLTRGVVQSGGTHGVGTD
jgi:hypothetical protein